jgi:hypothetical protein
MLAEVGKRLKLIELDLIKFSKGGKNQAAQGEQTFLADTVSSLQFLLTAAILIKKLKDIFNVYSNRVGKIEERNSIIFRQSPALIMPSKKRVLP